MRMMASAGSRPIIFFAASQVAPQGAPRSTSTWVMTPSAILTENSGAPNFSL
jgi:hypothetical protein